VPNSRSLTAKCPLDLEDDRYSAATVRLMKLFWTSLVYLPMWLLILAIRIYQWTLSPILGRQCRFSPTCSNYMIEALKKYGLVRGTAKGVMRICRCHPWHRGGYDPP
jgi:putative membrane protein insertion efficiency factor